MVYNLQTTILLHQLYRLEFLFAITTFYILKTFSRYKLQETDKKWIKQMKEQQNFLEQGTFLFSIF